MMKKVLALMLVLGMASLANVTVIDVIMVGPGSMGHAGTSSDPLASDLDDLGGRLKPDRLLSVVSISLLRPAG